MKSPILEIKLSDDQILDILKSRFGIYKDHYMNDKNQVCYPDCWECELVDKKVDPEVFKAYKIIESAIQKGQML